MWLFKLACAAVAAVSLVFILWAFMKFAALQDDAPPANVTSDIPGVTIVKAEPDNRQQKREQATMVLTIAGVAFVASLAGFGLARWRRSRPPA